MKTTFTALLFLYSLLPTWAQDTYPKMEGIGKFKVNASNLSLVEEISNELKCKIEMINSFEAYYQFSKGASRIYQIAPNDGSLRTGRPPESPICDGVEVFYINKYSVAGIPMSDVFLTFKDGLLVRFNCEPSTEFQEAIQLKYGKGALEIKKRTISCITKLTGAKIDYEEASFYQTWINGGIDATLTLSEYYNDECKKRYINIFSIKEGEAVKQINECERQIRTKATQSKEQELKKKLTDF